MNLAPNKNYFWRIRAEDTRNSYSDWSTGTWWFVYGTPASAVRNFSASIAGKINFSWERTDRAMYVYFKTNLLDGAWNRVAGPFYEDNAVLDTPPSAPSGFFKLSTE